MKIRLELTEAEACAALAEWASKKYGHVVNNDDVRFTIAPADDDPRAPKPVHIGSVSIEIAGLPTRS